LQAVLTDLNLPVNGQTADWVKTFAGEKQ